MYPGIEAITTSVISLALDAASLRQRAIAANIANVSTEGYTAMRVSFEEQLVEVREGLNANGVVDPFALSGVRPQMVPALDVAGQSGKVRLDVEVAQLAENTVRYQALLKGLNRHFAILNSAITDGRK